MQGLATDPGERCPPCGYWRRRAAGAALGAVALASAAGGSRAQELRLGMGYATHEPEQSASVVADVLFKPIRALSFMGSPRPYLGTQLSLGGDTNFAQTGLIWRFERKQVYLDLGAGLAVHDGKIDLPPPMVGLPPEENARRRHARDTHYAFGHRLQYHATFAVGWRLTERWAVEFEGQHWSNGHLGSETHDGVDSLGLRGAWRF